MALLGPAVGGLHLRRGVQGVLQTWMPSVLGELARRLSEDFPPGGGEPAWLETLVEPRSWIRLPDEDVWNLALDQSPAVVVTSGGVENTVRGEDGEWSAEWGISVLIYARGDTWELTSDLVAMYVLAARIAIAQHGVGVVGAKKPRWVGEAYREINTDVSRSLGAGRAMFRVRIGDVMNDEDGPLEPPVAPSFDYEEDPEVVSATPTVKPFE